MNAELLYTSAPQGLKQGSRGFCTVLSTVGMPLNLATKLESLSGYRHLYPSGTPDASKNPVGFSHLRFMVGGRHVSVLSRISDYGLDYSQRTNKLAHHIIVDAPLPACGPAALLAEPGVMRDHWDGQCVNVPSPPGMPILSSEPRICRKWEAITGDAGWGGVVAQAWLSASPRPVFIIFAEHQSRELLGLMEESIALLPTNKRWQATFSTYVTTLPPDVDCRVRCVVAGSDEARMAIARGTVIDLTINQNKPAHNEAIEAARKGLWIGNNPSKFEIPSEIKPPEYEDAESIYEQTQKEELEIELSLVSEIPLAAPQIGVPPTITRKQTSQLSQPSPTTETKRWQTNRVNKILALGILATCIVTALIGLTITTKSWYDLNIVSLENSKNPDRTTKFNERDTNDSKIEEIKPETPPQKQPNKRQDALNTGGPEPKQDSTPKDMSHLKELVAIKIEIPGLEGISPIAIRGKSIKVALAMKDEQKFNDEMKADFELLREKASYGLIEDEATAKDASQDIGGAIISIPRQYTREETQIVAHSCGLVMKSDVLTVINEAKPEDFTLRAIPPKMREIEARFLIPGDRVSGLLEIKNQSPNSLEYLKHLVEKSNLLWEVTNTGQWQLVGQSKNAEEFVIPEKTKGDSVLLKGTIPDTDISVETKPIQFIDSLSAVAEIDKDFKLNIRVSKPQLNDSTLQVKFGKKSFSDLLSVSDVVVREDKTDAARLLYNSEDLLSFVRDKRVVVNNDLKQFFGVVRNDAGSCWLLSQLHTACEKLEIRENRGFWLKKEDQQRKEVSSTIDRIIGLMKDYDHESANKSGVDLLKMLNEKSRKRNQVFPNDNDTERSRKQSLIDSECSFFSWYDMRSSSKNSGYKAFKDGIEKFSEIIKEIDRRTDTFFVQTGVTVERPKHDIVVIGGSDVVTEFRKMKLPIQIDTTAIVNLNIDSGAKGLTKNSDPRNPAILTTGKPLQ